MTMAEERPTPPVAQLLQKRSRGRPPKETKLVRYSVLWLEPSVADALSAECGSEKRTAVVRQLIAESLRARGRLPAIVSIQPSME